MTTPISATIEIAKAKADALRAAAAALNAHPRSVPAFWLMVEAERVEKAFL